MYTDVDVHIHKTDSYFRITTDLKLFILKYNKVVVLQEQDAVIITEYFLSYYHQILVI